MKGVIFNIVEDVITEHLGDAVWDRLLAEARVEHGYTALGNYPDAEIDDLVAAAAEALDASPRNILVWIGARAIPYFYWRYPRYFTGYASTQAFLPTLDQIIHPEVRKLYRDANPPAFECTPTDNGDLQVVYRSHRAMCGLAEGLMAGLGTHYEQSLSISHPECVHAGGDVCRFELTQVGA